MDIFHRSAVFALAVAAVFGGGAAASVFDDAVVYLQADSDLDGDGKITNGELRAAIRQTA